MCPDEERDSKLRRELLDATLNAIAKKNSVHSLCSCRVAYESEVILVREASPDDRQIVKPIYFASCRRCGIAQTFSIAALLGEPKVVEILARYFGPIIVH